MVIKQGFNKRLRRVSPIGVFLCFLFQIIIAGGPGMGLYL